MTAVLHWSLLPPANSPRRPFLLFSLSQLVAASRRSLPMVVLTQASLVPELSLSRYWCIW